MRGGGGKGRITNEGRKRTANRDDKEDIMRGKDRGKTIEGKDKEKIRGQMIKKKT